VQAMHWAIVASLISVATVSPAALAQYPGGHGTPPGSIKPRDRPTADASASSGAPVLVQLDQLENELKITSEQRAAWNAYADRILQLADEMTRSRFAARTSPPTEANAMQQMDKLAATERNRLAAIEEIAAAGKAFYATLTTEQQAIADRKLVLPLRPLAAGVALPGTGAANSGGAGQTNR
jgi:hypothetical protein